MITDSSETNFLKNVLKYSGWECDQSCVSNIRQVLTRESRMVSPDLCPRPLSRYDH